MEMDSWIDHSLNKSQSKLQNKLALIVPPEKKQMIYLMKLTKMEITEFQGRSLENSYKKFFRWSTTKRHHDQQNSFDSPNHQNYQNSGLYFAIQKLLMSSEQIQELREKLEAQQAEFENYKEECKQLQQFLEEEAVKKQQQIKKLKEEAIKKEKNYNLLKTQVGQLESENRNLKNELNEKKGGEDISRELESLKEEKDKMEKKNNELASSAKQFSLLQEQFKKVSEQNRQLRERLQVQTQKQKKEQGTQPKAQEPKNQQKIQKQVIKEVEKLIYIDRPQLVQELQKIQQLMKAQQKQVKELKMKNSYILTENEHLLKQLNIKESPDKKNYQIKEQLDDSIEEGLSNQSISALILTKKHYISPFLQLRSNNSIKIYKSTKSGYQKSLGALRYKLNKITYDFDKIINDSVENVKMSLQKGHKQNTILIFGIKKTSKKYIMAKILQKFKEYLLNLVQREEDSEAVYIKASEEPSKRLNLKGNNKEQIEAIMNKIIEMSQKSPKKSDPLAKKKPPSKPKIRYFRLTIGEENIQIITSSHTNVNFRNGSTIVQALNQICYGKLPSILQSAQANRQIILTLNPILNFYEECKKTLSIANCPQYPLTHSPSKHIESPIKQSLNEVVRKKVEIIEKQGEQNSLRSKRMEDQVIFYRSKFDELQVRLKNLLNTHSGQNAYLKKSPVTLSYQKMLKFIHTVLSRNNLSKKDNILDEGYNSEQQII